MRISLFLSAVALAGCAHVSDDSMVAQANRSIEQGFDQAWDRVKSGGQRTAQAGQYTFQRAEDGGVTVWHGVRSNAVRAIDSSQDALISAAVKSRLAADPATSARRIKVDTDQQRVTLSGSVRDQAEADAAVRDALAVPGVLEVQPRFGQSSASAHTRRPHM